MHLSGHQVALLSQTLPEGRLLELESSHGPRVVVIREQESEQVGSCIDRFSQVANKCARSACLVTAACRPLTCGSSPRPHSQPGSRLGPHLFIEV